MFAKTIIDSDAFLDMPSSSQCLYFHLAMRADDDGFINNPKKIQRVVGSSDDDLKLLIAKRFIIPFESGIVVIKHWKIHNYIRSDRKKDTVYTKEMELLTIKDNGSYTLNDEIPTLEDMSDSCQPDDNQATAECQHRLGKDRLGKDRLGKDRLGDTIVLDVPETPYKEIAELYNSICISFNPIKQITDKRKGNMNARYKESKCNIEVFKILFTKMQESNFLKGGWDSGGKADFDWVMRPTNFVKVLEGKYDNNKNQKKQPPKQSNLTDLLNMIEEGMFDE